MTRLAASSARPPIRAVEREGPIPLSFPQERLWFLWLLDRESPAYNLSLGLRLRGRLDADALELALAGVVSRHDALRTTFERGADGAVWQRIHEAVRFLLVRESVGGDPAELDRRAGAELRRPFDLEAGPLVRATLFRLAPEEHVLLVVLHHTVADGWSLRLLSQELTSAYGAFVEGRVPALEEAGIAYGDYAAWQREWLAGDALERQLAYWRTELEGLEPLDLPTDRPRPARRRGRAGTVAIALEPAVAVATAGFAAAERATPFMVLAAAFPLLLARYTRQADVAIGVPTAGRTSRELRRVVGCFVNTVVLRADLSGRPTFRELVGQARRRTLEGLAHQDAPFEQVVADLDPVRDPSRNPLFQALFAFESLGAEEHDLAGIDVTHYAPPAAVTPFDLELRLSPAGDRFDGVLLYAEDVLDRDSAEGVARQLGVLLTAALETPDVPVDALRIVSPAERRRLDRRSRGPMTPVPDVCLHELVEAQAAATGDAVAVRADGASVTYGDLDRWANRVARALRERGVRRGSRVAVSLPRGVELVVALLAVLKTGAAYVPVDPSYPPERVAFMLEDAGVELTLTAEEGLPEAGEADRPPPSSSTPLDPAYVIYTSGSTGLPKGSINHHGAVVNRLLWMRDEYGVGADDRILHKTPISFDVSVWELFLPLITGGVLVLARPGGHRDPFYLRDTLEAERITTVHFVPSMLRELLEVADDGLGDLRRVICSGEVLPRESIRRFFERIGCELHNLYGPTEAAIDVSAHRCRADDDGSVPIGRPIANVTLQVLDERLELVPDGVPGELAIGGSAVGHGYHDRPRLTANRFRPYPAAVGGSRVYLTGDLARRRPDGELAFLGRRDSQVKLNGIRIELGEVEAALEAHPDVAQAAAVVVDGHRLVAYVVAAREDVDVADVRGSLAQRLPEHSIPSALVVVPELPLTPSGKLDRRALPAPTEEAPVYAEPATETEAVLAGVWSELLEQERIGRSDDFFKLGGHSLLAMRMLGRASDAVQVEIPLRSVFDRPVLADLAREVDRLRAEGAPPPPPPIPRRARPS